MAEMTSHRATVTMPARDSRRRSGPSQGSSSPPAPSARPHPSNGTALTATLPAPPAARSPSVRDASVEVTERYLAPALQAAAAARARTARIRAAGWAAAAGPAWPYPRERLLAPDQSPEWSPDGSPAALLPPTMPSRDLQLAEMTTARTMFGLTATSAAGPAALPVVPPSSGAPLSRGLSVAEAVRASKIAFQPLRRQPPALPAPPTDRPHPTAEPPASGPIPTTVSEPAAPAKVVTAPPTKASQAPAAPTLPPKTAAPVVPTAPATAVTRPGAARLQAAEAFRRTVPERPARQQRFAKTIAELQRYQAATRPSEPWGNVVPRPAVPQSNPATTESRWSRLWSRR
jgi:hypothetical protein